jgi:hypothetical protein
MIYCIYMYVRGDLIKGMLIFNILTGISPQPCEFFDFRDLIISLISLVVTGANCMQGNGLMKTLVSYFQMF